jgi:hypothetical protein
MALAPSAHRAVTLNKLYLMIALMGKRRFDLSLTESAYIKKLGHHFGVILDVHTSYY